MSAQHTPGPWNVLAEQDNHRIWGKVGGATLVIADVGTAANAQLIVQAPTLAETMRDLIAALDNACLAHGGATPRVMPEADRVARMRLIERAQQELRAAGINHDGDPSAEDKPEVLAATHIMIGKHSFAVTDIAQASVRYQRVRDASGQGASRFPAGLVYRGERHIATVSYNGRVWEPGTINSTRVKPLLEAQ